MDEATSHNRSYQSGRSLASVIMTLISAGPTSSGNASGAMAMPWISDTACFSGGHVTPFGSIHTVKASAP